VAARYAGQRATLETRRINWIDENGIADRSFDVVVEATGTPGGFEAALKAVRPRGTIVLKSTFKEMQQVSFSSVVVDEITLIGSRCGPFAPAIRMIESGRVEPVPLIENRFVLEDAEKAFQAASRTGTLKVIFTIS
jgi:threonine dehydrogenase-like Zn-dependent dehydrogenase